VGSRTYAVTPVLSATRMSRKRGSARPSTPERRGLTAWSGEVLVQWEGEVPGDVDVFREIVKEALGPWCAAVERPQTRGALIFRVLIHVYPVAGEA